MKYDNIKPMIEEIIYTGDAFKTILTQYDSREPAMVMLEVIVGTLMDLMKKLKMDRIDLELMFYAGVITALDVNDAIQQTGRKPVEGQALSNAISGAALHFLSVNKGKYDPKEVKAKMTELQQMGKSGKIEQMMTQQKQQRGLLAK